MLFVSCVFNLRKRISYGLKILRDRHVGSPDFQLKRRLCVPRFAVPESNISDLLAANPHEFAEYLRSKSINRAYIIWDEDSKGAVASHSALQPIADWLNNETLTGTFYKKHEAIFLQLGVRTGCLLGAFIWQTNRGEAYGGIRLTEFPNMTTFLQDGLRLSVRLGRKSALAGLWAGGGKGLIPVPKDKKHHLPNFRQQLFSDYGDFISSLNGCYITGTDIGVNVQDLYNVHSRTRWSVCVPEDVGGCGNAFQLLARGVVCSIEAALDYLNLGSLDGKEVAVQGAGGVGFQLVSELIKKRVRSVYVTDTNQKRVFDLKDAFYSKAGKRLTVDKVSIGNHKILSHPCDILSPCAVGHVSLKKVFGENNIPTVNAKIVCGTANAQLKDEKLCSLLEQNGVTFIAESLPNRMAVVNSVYEPFGRMPTDLLKERHFDKQWQHSIYVLTQRMLHDAANNGIPTLEATNRLADEYSRELHPLYPGRAKQIIRGLVETKWAEGHDFWHHRHNFYPGEGCA